jgi:MoxR-like ATPase
MTASTDWASVHKKLQAAERIKLEQQIKSGATPEAAPLTSRPPYEGELTTAPQQTNTASLTGAFGGITLGELIQTRQAVAPKPVEQKLSPEEQRLLTEQNQARSTASCMFDAMSNSERLTHLSTLAIARGLAAPGNRGNQALIELQRDMADAQLKLPIAIKRFTSSGPDQFLGFFGRQIEQYRGDLESGRIVRVPYVKELIKSIHESLNIANSATLHGHTGFGKTEIAKIAGREYSNGRDALVVRCYQNMPIQDVMGHKKLSESDQQRAALVVEQIDAEVTEWERSQGSAVADDQRKEARAEIAARLCAKGNVTVSEYVLGAAYKAAKEGRVLILDEYNYIPDGMRATLNDILTKRPGEIIHVQEEGSSFAVAEGFGVIKTGNINTSGSKTYNNRLPEDPAQLERGYSKEVKGLPQQTDGRLDQALSAEENQLFQIALAALLTKEGAIYAPAAGGDTSPLETVWRLSQFAKITQLAFCGELAEDSPHRFQISGVPADIKVDTMLSQRGLIRVLEAWMNRGYSVPIDNLLYNEIIERTLEPRQKAFFYQQAKLRGFFRSEDGWPEDPTTTANWKGNFSITPPSALAKEPGVQILVTPDEVVQSIFGKAPERTVWPDEFKNVAAEQQDLGALKLQLETFLEETKKEFNTWKEELGDLCPLT